MENRRCIVVIFGPTGVGKSTFGDMLAKKLNGDIINADVGQFYTPFSIGTAKPLWKTSATPHHFFDIVHEPKNISSSHYRGLVQKKIKTLWEQDRIPIIVGGSTLYIMSLFFPPRIHTGTVKQSQNGGACDGWEHLSSIDPLRAQSIHKNDTYRIARALDIWNATGDLPSGYSPLYDPVGPFHLFFLTREREELYRIINDRVVEMVNEGWAKEVQSVKGTPWEPFIHKKKLIGYNEILTYLDKNSNEDQNLSSLINVIQQRTRHYAKRQHVFWRMLKKKLLQAQIFSETTSQTSKFMEINLTERTFSDYVNEINL